MDLNILKNRQLGVGIATLIGSRNIAISMKNQLMTLQNCFSLRSPWKKYQWHHCSQDQTGASTRPEVSHTFTDDDCHTMFTHRIT